MIPLNEVPPTWSSTAGCADVPVEIMYPRHELLEQLEDMDLPAKMTRDARSELDELERAVAEKVCAGCPVELECREYAIHTRQYGVWGGMSRQERLTIRRQRARGSRSHFNFERTSSNEPEVA